MCRFLGNVGDANRVFAWFQGYLYMHVRVGIAWFATTFTLSFCLMLPLWQSGNKCSDLPLSIYSIAHTSMLLLQCVIKLSGKQ